VTDQGAAVLGMGSTTPPVRRTAGISVQSAISSAIEATSGVVTGRPYVRASEPDSGTNR
jgi:hypothetical protein